MRQLLWATTQAYVRTAVQRRSEFVQDARDGKLLYMIIYSRRLDSVTMLHVQLFSN